MQEGDFYKIRVPEAPEIGFGDLPQDASKEPPEMRTRDILVRIEAFQGRVVVVSVTTKVVPAYCGLIQECSEVYDLCHHFHRIRQI